MAAAAPWVQEDGGLYARTSVARETVEGLDGVRADLYAEYGLSPRITLTGKFDYVAYPDASDFDTQGWRTSLRYRLAQQGGLIWSVEAGALEGAAIGGRNGCDDLGGEVRTGLAWSGDWQDRQTLLFGEVAGRLHADCERTRYAFGLGQKASDNLWSITQVWLERGATNASSDKFQTEMLWRTPTADFSLGYRRENGGNFKENSIFLALARQF